MAMLAAILVFAASAAFVETPSPQQEAQAALAERAQQAEQHDDFATAVRQYQALARQLPENAEVASNLGVALYFNHQWEQAIAVLHRAMVRNPHLLAPHLFTGLAEYQLSRAEAAVPQLAAAVRLQPSDLLARTWLGYAYAAQQQYELAVKQFTEVTRLAPENIDAWYALGQAWLQIGRRQTAALLRADPDGGRTWQLAAEQLRLQGNRAKALTDYVQAASRRPDIPELRTAIAELGGSEAGLAAALEPVADHRAEDALYAQAHHAEQNARAAFEQVLTIAPDSYRAHQILADAYVLQQQDAKAIEEYRTVLKLKPDLPGIHESIGSVLLRTGDTAGALAEFESERMLQPHSASVNTLVGQAQMLLGRNDAAEATLHAALAMDLPPVETWRLLGKLELHKGDYQAAARDLNHYVAVKENDATAWYLLSRAYRGLGARPQMAAALAQYGKLSQDARQRGEAQSELARINGETHVEDGSDKEAASTVPHE